MSLLLLFNAGGLPRLQNQALKSQPQVLDAWKPKSLYLLRTQQMGPGLEVDNPPFGIPSKSASVILSAWVAPDPPPVQRGPLSPGIPGQSVDNPPFVHPGRTKSQQAIAVTLSQPDPWGYLFYGGRQPYDSINLLAGISVDNPPFTRRLSEQRQQQAYQAQPDPWVYAFGGGHGPYTTLGLVAATILNVNLTGAAAATAAGSFTPTLTIGIPGAQAVTAAGLIRNQGTLISGASATTSAGILSTSTFTTGSILSIQTFTDLQLAISDYMARSDLDSTHLTTFIQLCESSLNADPEFRLRQMQTFTTLTPNSSGVVTLPSDFLELRSVKWTGSPSRTLPYTEYRYLSDRYPDSPSADAQVYSVSDTTLQIMPVDQTPVRIEYWAEVPGLSIANPTNWLIAAWPNLYLFGALVEGYAYVQDLQKGQIWQERYDRLLSKLTKSAFNSRGPANARGGLVMDTGIKKI